MDTNALIWYLSGSKRLSVRARAIFEAAERGETRLVISAIVIAEMFYADQKHGLFVDFADTYRQMKSKPYFRFVPLTSDAILDFAQDIAIPEMHDRIITGLARRLDAPLVTSDPVIAAAGLVEVIG